jgi:hypothetical protein
MEKAHSLVKELTKSSPAARRPVVRDEMATLEKGQSKVATLEKGCPVIRSSRENVAALSHLVASKALAVGSRRRLVVTISPMGFRAM